MEIFMNRIGSGIYHYPPHPFGQNSLVCDIVSSNCKGGWEIEPNYMPKKKRQTWSLDGWRKDG